MVKIIKKIKSEKAKAASMAKKELAKAKKKLLYAEKTVKTFVKKHPAQAAAVVANAAVAVGTAVAAAIKKAKKKR